MDRQSAGAFSAIVAGIQYMMNEIITLQVIAIAFMSKACAGNSDRLIWRMHYRA